MLLYAINYQTHFMKIVQCDSFCRGGSLLYYLYYNWTLSLISLSVALIFGLQTEFWADRFSKCLKMFHLTYFLYYKVLALVRRLSLKKTQNGYLWLVAIIIIILYFRLYTACIHYIQFTLRVCVSYLICYVQQVTYIEA